MSVASSSTSQKRCASSIFSRRLWRCLFRSYCLWSDRSWPSEARMFIYIGNLQLKLLWLAWPSARAAAAFCSVPFLASFCAGTSTEHYFELHTSLIVATVSQNLCAAGLRHRSWVSAEVCSLRYDGISYMSRIGQSGQQDIPLADLLLSRSFLHSCLLFCSAFRSVP